jgi:hypothetical protein
MNGKPIKVGDQVALSAVFLRSLGTLCFGPNILSGVSTYDRGVGVVIRVVDEWLAEVHFRNGPWTGNVFNLVHREDIHFEASAAEHKDHFR